MDAKMITSSDEFRAAIKARREELGLTGEQLDAIVGLTRGHVGKIEHGDKPWGKRAFRMEGAPQMTASIDWILDALGLALVLVPRDHVQRLTEAAHTPEPKRSAYTPRSGDQMGVEQTYRMSMRIRRPA